MPNLSIIFRFRKMESRLSSILAQKSPKPSLNDKETTVFLFPNNRTSEEENSDLAKASNWVRDV